MAVLPVPRVLQDHADLRARPVGKEVRPDATVEKDRFRFLRATSGRESRHGGGGSAGK